MHRSIALMGTALGLGLIALPLAGCATDGYGYGGGVGVAWVDSPYDVYYDDYYGPIYDGYWGGDNYFYYRSSATGSYHRGDSHHFRHDTGTGNTWHRYQGTTHQPPRGTSMPHYPRNGSNNNNGNNRHHHAS